MTYKEENDILLNKTYKDYYYKNWRTKAIEFIFSPYCNLKCKYCYINNHYNEQFPIETFNAEKSIDNALKICQWLVNNHYTPELDIFSGELFAQESGFQLLEKILNFYAQIPKEDRIKDIVIPTNGTFCGTKNEERVETLIKKSFNLDIPLYLSLSIDGKYMDEDNRPGVKRDYNAIFKFAQKHNLSFHPMIYSNNIEKWKENFNWFQENFSIFGINWQNLYLLQVRNKEWTREQDRELYEFIKYIINWTWKKCNKNIKEYFNFLFNENKGFNILNWLNIVHNGYSCSIQQELSIRLNDMKVFPCHRLMYPEFEIGQYDENMILKSKNVSLGVALPYIRPINAPLCDNCDINELCQGGCLGSQYETTKSILTPIPTVCLNYIYLFKGLVDGFDEIGVLDKMIERFDNEKNLQINKLRRLNIDEL